MPQECYFGGFQSSPHLPPPTAPKRERTNIKYLNQGSEYKKDLLEENF